MAIPRDNSVVAGETILVVDDAAVTLKLVASILRGEGYRVQLASTAEQAVSTLRTLRPELILIDIHLPGMDGLELAREVREDPRLKDVVLVAMSASTREGIEQEAIEAGCRGFIPKPVDPRKLRSAIQQFLAEEPEAEPALGTAEPEQQAILSSLPLTGPEMEGLRRAFLEEALARSKQLVASLDTYFDVRAAQRLLFQWIGAAGLFGYPAISTAALQMEPLLSASQRDAGLVRESLSNLVLAFSDAAEAAHTTLPDALIAELEGKRIALVGFADTEAERICSALERVGARPRLFAADITPNRPSIRDCEAIMIHVRPDTMSLPWLSPLFTPPPGAPIILVGAREHLLQLDAAVQSRIREFLIDGWQPEEVLMRLRFALAAPAPPIPPQPVRHADTGPEKAAEPARKPQVLIVDDENAIQRLVKAVLTNHGLECRLASDGAEALRAIREFPPQAAVLDVNMPGINGFEVLSEIRREGWPVRVILLTARQQDEDLARGFTAGADDYLIKPFNPMELVLRLKRLL